MCECRCFVSDLGVVMKCADVGGNSPTAWANTQRDEPGKSENTYFRRVKAWPPPRPDIYTTIHTSETDDSSRLSCPLSPTSLIGLNAFRFKDSVTKKTLENYAGIINRRALKHILSVGS